MTERTVSPTILRRLPVYLHYLTSLRGKKRNVSASVIAAHFGLNDVQVRKDLGAVSGTGRPKTGYDVEELIDQMERCLGCRSETKAVLVGAGNLGRALLSYGGFADYGLHIVAAFDADESLCGAGAGGKPVYPMSQMEDFCRQEGVRLGIITVPVDAAQAVCDRMVACGIRAVWNFSPTLLTAPKDVLTENENLASSLAVLSRHLMTPGGEAEA